MKYEYGILELRGRSATPLFPVFADDPEQHDIDELDRLGADRWEAFAAVAAEDGRTKVFLKREVLSAHPDNTVVNIVNTVMPRGRGR